MLGVGVRDTTMVTERSDSSAGPLKIGARDGHTINLGSLGVRFMIYDVDSGGGFSLVEHPIPARHLAAPVHRHSREDEYSYVVEGRLGALLGDDEVYADVGDLVVKPRHQWHTFWNAGDSLCRILEIISPAGFEHYFEDLAQDVAQRARVQQSYGLESDLDSTRRLCERLGLRFPGIS
jgi:mannose-6-phosphate isomerase-like protein (cupin superfamily)